MGERTSRLCFVALGLLMALLVVYQTEWSDYVTFEQSTALSDEYEKYIILGWNKFGGKTIEDSWYGQLSNCSNAELQHRCAVTSNRELLNKSHLVVFEGHIDAFDGYPNLDARSSSQRYALVSYEPPEWTSIDRYPKEFFNWTYTWRTDSTIWLHYELIPVTTTTTITASSRNELRKQVYNLYTGRKKLVAWLVSHCGAPSGRDKVASLLSQHVSLDIYGKCGTLSCPSDDTRSCDEMVKKDYMFYLSFENNMCQGYVTEKLKRAVDSWVVPVVLWRAQVGDVLPKEAFIAVDDFPTVKGLADYLQHLSGSFDAYFAYFEWRTQFSGLYDIVQICSLCEGLVSGVKTSPVAFSDPINNNSWYLDSHSWWRDTNICRTSWWT